MIREARQWVWKEREHASVCKPIPCGYSLRFSSFFFLLRASPRSRSEQAAQMVFVDGFAQSMQSCFLASATVSLLNATRRF